MRLTVGSLFSGVGGFDLGLEAAGMAVRWFVEIDEACRSVLERHWPEVPQYGDITGVAGRDLEPVDVVAGGSPCQAFSVAGLRQSLDDERGNLALEFCRVVDELRPAWVIWENVPGVLNTPDNAFGCILAALVGESAPFVPVGGRWTNAGLVAGPARSAAWRVLDAKHFGVPQRRRRVFVVAHSGDWRAPAQVLFEPACLCGDSQARRTAGEDLAGTLTSGASRSGGFRQDLDGTTYIPVTANVTHTLRAEGHDASEDGTGRGTPLVPVIMPTLTSNGDAAASHGALPMVHQPPVAVRRLTPRECERLQGWPDDHTRYRADGTELSDTARYRMVGNGVAAPVAAWIGRRILAYHAHQIERSEVPA